MSEQTFSDSLEAFFRALRRSRVRFARKSLDGLSAAQYLLVVPLLDGRARSVRELAEGVDVAAPTATRTLDSLERDGLIVRRHSTEDRRCVLVELTDTGREVVTAARAEVRRRRRRLYDALEPGERDDAEHLLRRLAEIIDVA